MPGTRSRKKWEKFNVWDIREFPTIFYHYQQKYRVLKFNFVVQCDSNYVHVKDLFTWSEREIGQLEKHWKYKSGKCNDLRQWKCVEILVSFTWLNMGEFFRRKIMSRTVNHVKQLRGEEHHVISSHYPYIILNMK